jgi:hypothetical protein
VRPVSFGLAGVGMTAVGDNVEIIRFSSARSSVGSGLSKHFCCNECISVGDRMES